MYAISSAEAGPVLFTISSGLIAPQYGSTILSPDIVDAIVDKLATQVMALLASHASCNEKLADFASRGRLSQPCRVYACSLREMTAHLHDSAAVNTESPSFMHTTLVTASSCSESTYSDCRSGILLHDMPNVPGSADFKCLTDPIRSASQPRFA